MNLNPTACLLDTVKTFFLTDQGRKYTHKEQIIKLFLMRLSNTEIAQRSSHSLEAVENYVREFLRVNLLHREHKAKPVIAQLIHKSLFLVKEYIALYHKLEFDEYFKGSVRKKVFTVSSRHAVGFKFI